MSETNAVPNPGSKEALDKGCICAVYDNAQGDGFLFHGEKAFWVTQGCPVHCPKPRTANDGDSS